MKRITRIRIGIAAGIFTLVSVAFAVGYNHLSDQYAKGICDQQSDASAPSTDQAPHSLIQSDSSPDQTCKNTNIFHGLQVASEVGAVLGLAVAAGALTPMIGGDVDDELSEDDEAVDMQGRRPKPGR